MAVVAIVCALLASCRSLDGATTDTTQLSDDAVVLGVPLLQQDELYECGLATVSALCRFHERELPPEHRDRLIEIAARENGLSGAELREALEAVDMDVFIFPGTLDEPNSGLFHHIDRGRPVLVMVSSDEQSHHYCLVTGYDGATDSIVVLDPRRGQLVFPTAAFQDIWSRSGHFSLLCLPRQSSGKDSS